MIWRGLAVFTAVVVAAVPWGLPGETTFILPFITLLLIFLYSVPKTQPIPVWLVFLAGLATDALTAGPLGYWAFIYTMGHTLAQLQAREAPVRSASGLCLSYALTAVLVASVGWALASIYYLRAIDWWPIALGTISSILISPLFVWLMRRSLGIGRIRGLAEGR